MECQVTSGIAAFTHCKCRLLVDFHNTKQTNKQKILDSFDIFTRSIYLPEPVNRHYSFIITPIPAPRTIFSIFSSEFIVPPQQSWRETPPPAIPSLSVLFLCPKTLSNCHVSLLFESPNSDLMFLSLSLVPKTPVWCCRLRGTYISLSYRVSLLI